MNTTSSGLHAKKTSYSFLFILQYKSCAFGRRELEFHFLNPAKVLEPFCDATWNVTQYSFKLGLKLVVCDIFRRASGKAGIRNPE